MPARPEPDGYPSMLWVAIPPTLLLAGYFLRKYYLVRRLRLHGIGKGAPGFQTNVRRIRVTAEIAARLRRGEDVSPEEIAAAAVQAEAQGKKDETEGADVSQDANSHSPAHKAEEPDNEWLPDYLKNTSTKARRRRKK